MSGRGVIGAEIFRVEQLSLAKRGTTDIPGSDPNNPAVGEIWPRTDLSPSVSNATTFGVMRIQGPTGTLDWPIIDIDDASKLGPDVYIGATLKIAEPGANPNGTQLSKTGFLPVTDQGGSLGSPRLLHNGVEYQAHDALGVSAIPDSVETRPDDDSSVSSTGPNGLVILTKTEWPSIGCRISNQTSDATTAHLRDSDGNVIKTVDITGLSAGDAFTFNDVNLQSGNEYEIVFDAGGSNFTSGFNQGDGDYPYESPDVDIVARIFEGVRDQRAEHCVNDIGNVGFS